MSKLFCKHLGTCGGCAWGLQPLAEQRERKLSEVRELAPNARLLPVGDGLRLRDRADLVWQGAQLGMYDISGHALVDLGECAMMSPRLHDFFVQFRQRVPPIQRKGSVRLRVSPTGERGVWLDFANQDVKILFDEVDYLRWLSDLAFVEIGQKRKKLTWVDGRPKLVDPELKPWFEVKGTPLFGPVGGFTQSGFAANEVLAEQVIAAASGVDTWIELFCGHGNLAVALAQAGHTVHGYELEPLAVSGLKQLIGEQPQLKIEAHQLDVYLKSDRLPSMKGMGLLVDPPRAGLRQVLEALARMPKVDRPKAIIYVSCFTEVFKAEVPRLFELGYKLRTLTGVDQFPHSPHSEWVGLLSC